MAWTKKYYIKKSSKWNVKQLDGTIKSIDGPIEFRHTLSTVINGLIKHGFVTLGMWEHGSNEEGSEQGSWEHFKSTTPLYITFWTKYDPGVFGL